MDWRSRYSTNGYVSRGRGLSGVNVIEELKKPISDQQATSFGGYRKFGTELSSNTVNNRNSFKNIEIVNHNIRKRTFKEITYESKQEEKSEEFDEYEQPKKKQRYISNKTMELDSDESCEEDIDLIQYNKKVTKNNKKKDRVLLPQPVRRSARLAKKREKQMKNKNKKMINNMSYIEDDNINNMEEFDSRHLNDDLHVLDYVNDITLWYYECETLQLKNKLIESNYIKSFQPDLNGNMRCILLNWLMNVHRRFQLLDQTLFLAIYIFDSFLSKKKIKRDKLQLFGCSAMLIAAKYHEIYAPEGNDFSYISDRAFDTNTLFEAELQILIKLKFKFADIITPLHFIERYLQIVTFPLWKKYQQRNTKKSKKDGEKYITLVKELSYYFAELSLFDIKLISNYKPSLVATASICFSILGISLYARWPDFMQKHTNYSYKDLKPVLNRLNEFRKISNQKNFTSVRRKHKSIEQWIDKLNIQHAINNQ
mmetsp:Transcript_56113/g.50472  ORF Transcript_56113/g.50472 Transcript_56113/m.50472 type:complete len:482 (-) Transcript_56113:79-1524(-)